MSDRRNDIALSERYRLAALDWVELDSAARMLEEGKTTYLAQQKALLGDIADAKAERIVKSGEPWADYIKTMVRSKTAAERQRVEVKFLEMQHREWISMDANARAERKM